MVILFVALGLVMVFRTGNSHPMRSATWVKANPRDISERRARVGGAVLLEHLVTIAATATVAGLATKHGGNEQWSLLNGKYYGG